ncbi:hypothetical protein [Candidatus Enterococcus clewellii]|uniref:Uncharacterized protein n=1 Tax=Candidatus Enterococcus clewellii TaxID=1834193 RepID=A0A242K737_9ENTE|nr:hypothetical protein [Enterococcus sp. 9E7_DIV0242]OTP16132.1 hypothetical protein A5888_002346 [Enterococcus sp. 9E7_DIV0242]
MNRKKLVSSYLVIALLLFLFQKVYHFYGHGVISFALSSIWIAPLIVGLLFTVFLFGKPNKRDSSVFRLSVNLMNTSLAIFTVGLILTGVTEIAGTDSPYILYFYVVSFLFLVPASIVTMVAYIK